MSLPINRITLCLLAALALASPASAQGLTRKWTDVRSSLVPGAEEDDLSKLAVDRNGNVFTAATSNDRRTKSILVRKTNSAGAMLWQRRMSSPLLGNLTVNAVATDSSGNLFVTGYGSTTGATDIYTAKLSGADGSTMWEKTDGGSNNVHDLARAIAVDPSGNVIIGGTSGTFSGPARTIKYAGSNGTVLWNRSYSSSSNSYNVINDLKCDASGNVVVTGSGGGDIYTAKYAANNGSVLWEKRYNGPANSTESGFALALDSGGNALVTGYSDSGSTTRDDLIALKYSASNGTQLWERRINGTANGDDAGVHIACDSQGNPTIFGFRQTNPGNIAKSFYLVKCSANNGSILWEKTENGPGYFEAYESDRLVLDAQGNAIVTNNGYVDGREVTVTAKYSASNGNSLWRKTYTWETASTNTGFQIRHGGMAIALDPAGSVLVAGISTAQTADVDVLTQKLDPATGNTVWSSRLDGDTNLRDHPSSVIFDSAGNVVTAGLTEVGYDMDVVIRKINRANGTMAWEKRFYAQDSSNDDYSIGLGAATNGDVYVACHSEESSSDNRLYLARFAAASGNVVWQKRFLPAGAIYDRRVRMQTDAAGNIYLAATVFTGGSGASIYIGKFGSNGNALWEKTFRDPSPIYRSAQISALALTPSGDVLVTGSTESSQSYYMRTVKFAGGNGAVLWSRHGSNPDVRGTPYAVTSDADGNAAITGMEIDSRGYARMYTAKYASATGALLWEKNYPGGGNSAHGRTLAMDSAGNVIASGQTRTPTGQRTYDWYTVKYAAADGTQIWERGYTGSGGGDDQPEGMAVDSAGDVIITGYTGNSTDTINGSSSIATNKYSGATGVVLSQDLYHGKYPIREQPVFESRPIAISADNAVAITGGSAPTGQDSDVVTILFESASPKLAVEYPSGTPVTGNATIDFGFVSSSGPLPNFIFTLQNTGSAILSLGTIRAEGPESALFTIVQPTAPSLAAGGQTTFGIRPQSQALGQHTATIVIPSNDPGTPAFGFTVRFTTPSRNAELTALAGSPEPLSPSFAPAVRSYRVTLPFEEAVLQLTATTADASATVRIMDHPAPSGSATPVSLPVGTTTVPVQVTAQDPAVKNDYQVIVTRLGEKLSYTQPADVPITVDGFVAAHELPPVELGFPPVPGTTLTVVNNLSTEPIAGRFSNLEHGKTLVIARGEKSFRFAANYFGGDGNDLVLVWADTAIHGWGSNNHGQLGTADGSRHPVLQSTAVAGAQEGKTTFGTAAGYLHSLALAADGTISAWGSNTFGQLGDGTKTSRDVPATVKADGALSGKMVIAVAAGGFHGLALCSDGTVAAWGYNNHGQLGNGGSATATEPVAVEAGGALAGKRVVAIAAGAYHSMARCSDGTLVTWGFNGTGALGIGSSTGSAVPVEVTFPVGTPRVTAMAAGQYHSAAILSDGTLYCWGQNNHGQVGSGTMVDITRPAAIPLPLAVRQITAGGSHTLALVADGRLFAWGKGSHGQIGDGSMADRLAPVPVGSSGALAGEQITALSAGMNHSLAFLAGGGIATWGDNASGQLGNGTTGSSAIPVEAVLPTEGSIPMDAASSSSSTHVLSTVALPVPAPSAPEISPLVAWRQQHFGQTENSGDDGDDADPDHDGIPNLVEYAFGSDPWSAEGTTIPGATVKDGYLVIEFTASAEKMGVHFGASATRELGSEDWQTLQDEGEGDHHLFRILLGGKSGFIRLHVTPR